MEVNAKRQAGKQKYGSCLVDVNNLPYKQGAVLCPPEEATMAAYSFPPYLWILMGATVLALISILLLWGYRKALAAHWAIFLEIAIAFWSFTAFFEGAAATVELKYLWSKITYFGILFTSPLYFLFAYEFALQKRIKLTIPWMFWVFVIPILAIGLAWTNELHWQIWTEVAIAPETNIGDYGHGLLWYLIMGYHYINILGALVLFAIAYFNFTSMFKIQALMVLIGSLIPVSSNLLYLFDRFPIPGLEPTPFALSIASLFISLSFLYFNLFKLIPVAQTSIIDNMEDAIFVLDKTNQVLSLNPAAEKLVQISASRSIGKSIQFFSSLVSAMDKAGFSWTSNTACEGEIELAVQGNAKTYNTRLLPLASGEDTQDGKILLLHDITEKKQYEREREQLISKLQQALAEVKTLNGLLPICASCKKIRDDQGYWQEVEQYIGSRTDADFSHGLCPECFKKLFPDIYREKYEHVEEDGSNKEIDTKTN